MRVISRPGRLLLLIMACFTATGCPAEWHLTINDLSDPTHPVMCVSRSRGCRGDGVSLPFFVVERFDATKVAGAPTVSRDAWVIEPVTVPSLREFTYGVVPAGWRETQPASALRPGEWYTVGPFFFRISSGVGGARADVCPIAEFLERVNSGQTPGCRATEN